MNHPSLCCPRCTRPLVELACKACGVIWPSDADLVDLRVETSEREPRPLASGALTQFFQATSAGAGYREAFEALLLGLDTHTADRLMQLVREARGAWHPLLHDVRGTALFLGNAYSGTITALANNGYMVTVVDPCAERVRFALRRAMTNSPGRVRGVVAGDGARLPFADAAFTVVIQEDGLPAHNGLHAHALREALRVAGSACLLTADNRLAYKRSLGVRGDFVRMKPAQWVSNALHPRRGERTLLGYRKAMRKLGWEPAEAFALYPHALDWSHAVALDAERPALTVGPNERRNRLKIVAQSAGLFPVFTPSFALHARRTTRAPRRIERILQHIARVTGEPQPEIDILIATRGQSSVIHTCVPTQGADEPRGRWTLHMPLCPKNEPQLELHMRSLRYAREQFPALPVPEPLYGGRIEGLWLACERRLPQHAMPQIGRDRDAVARALAHTAHDFAGLLVRRSRAYDAVDHERLVGRTTRLVAERAVVAGTLQWLATTEQTAWKLLQGRSVPFVLYHGDLRGKHVQVRPDGHVLGYLDWGTTEFEGLPLFDLLHLLVHERKQHTGCSAAEAWRSIQDPNRREPAEQHAIDVYRARLGVDDATEEALCLLYPMLVAATAEQHWDYSRPRWLHRQFDV